VRRRDFITLLGGAAAAWPLTARAQQPALPVIGWLDTGASSTKFSIGNVAFLRDLNEAGYVEGRDLAIEYRWAEDQFDRLPALAADLVRRRVSVIYAPGSNLAALAAKAATSTIPIVFSMAVDPVKIGLVASLARPGGNVTGVTNMAVELGAKRIELLHELVPKAGVVSVLVNPTNLNSKYIIEDAQAAARALGLRADVVGASSEREIDTAFAGFVQRGAGALTIAPDPFFIDRPDQFVALAARHALPAVYPNRGFVTAGGLMTYSADFLDMPRQAAGYVARILRGAKPADLPVLQPTKFELAINLKTARALGLEVPPLMLGRADEVIE
jgi:putative ABC transport system substrate-binding protein